jgi:hypothetical protein
VAAQVTGSYFRDEYWLTCSFGAAGIRNATLSSSTLLRCLSPTAAGAGTVSLEISSNNQQFSSSAVPYLYQRTCVCGLVTVQWAYKRNS